MIGAEPPPRRAGACGLTCGAGLLVAALAAAGGAPPHAARVDYTPAPQWPPGLAELARASVPPGARALVLGASSLLVPRGARVGTQVDRVVRDIHWTPSAFDGRVPADRAPTGEAQVVPYMEGARVRELIRHAGVTVVPLTPVRVQLRNEGGHRYGLADDGEGRFRFVVDSSKLDYATARPGADGTLELSDTHGFNTVAAAALRARPTLAVACMDMSDKAAAALWLAQHGIAAYATTDRFAYELLGYRLAFPEAAPILAGAPIRAAAGGALLGDQPLRIELDEPIVAQWTARQSYPWQYADTPWRYFAALADLYGLDLDLHKVNADAGELPVLLARARALGARVVAVRVGKTVGEDEADRDAAALGRWLRESPRHRAVLFHSAAYAPGYRLLFEFPRQTTFGDLSPRFEGVAYGETTGQAPRPALSKPSPNTGDE